MNPTESFCKRKQTWQPRTALMNPMKTTQRLSSQTFHLNDHYDIVSYSVCSDHSKYLQLPYSFLLSWLLSYNLLWSLSYQLKWSLSPKYSTIASLSLITVVTLTSRVEATVTPIPQWPLLHQWQRPFSDPNTVATLTSCMLATPTSVTVATVITITMDSLTQSTVQLQISHQVL